MQNFSCEIDQQSTSVDVDDRTDRVNADHSRAVFVILRRPPNLAQLAVSTDAEAT